MPLINEVTSAKAFSFSVLGINRLLIFATGNVSSSGWSDIRFSPVYGGQNPDNGIWEIHLVGDAPSGLTIPLEIPVATSGILVAPSWLKGVRIVSAKSALDVNLTKVAAPVEAPFTPFFSERRGGHVIYSDVVASYDDSFQPIGFCSGFGSIKMKKLHHELTLIVEGPDESKIRHCVQQAVAIGLIAALVAAYGTGGLALPAAISAFIAHLEGCLGAEFQVKIDDRSHWIEWCT